MRRYRAINVELTRRRVSDRLARDSWWLYFGCFGSLAWLTWFFSRGWEISTSFDTVYGSVQYLAVWNALFCALYVMARWFWGRGESEDADLAQLPLSRTHWFVQRLIDTALIPVAFLVLTLPLFTIFTLYHAAPYGHLVERYVVRYGDEDPWAFLPDPWGWRVFFVHLNLLFSGLLPVGLAVFLRESLRTAWLRIIVFILVGAGLYFVSERVRYEFLELAYRRHTPLDRWPFILLLLLLLLVPLLLGLVHSRARRWLLALALGITVVFSLLPYLQYAALGVPFTAWLRDTLGDTRFAMALFLGHLNPLENNRLLLESYVSALLFNAAPLLPRRLSVWVCAGLYPLCFALWLLFGPWLGYWLHGQPARTEE